MVDRHYAVRERLCGGHVPAALGALGKDFGAELAVVGVMLFALLGTRLTGVGARFSELSAVIRVAGHKPRMECREVGNVPTQADTLGHAFPLVGTRISTPLAHFGGFETILDTVALLVAQVVNLGRSFFERHCIRWYCGSSYSGSADIRKATPKS